MNSQVALEREIYDTYHIDPATISYVEAHGTGTKLGDPIELEALSTVFQEKTDRRTYCALGSVKSNIGHTTAAAGVASLHKVLLCLQHKRLVPSLNFSRPNSHFNFDESPFYVNTQYRPWPNGDQRPLRAAVSSFGFSGTNAHVVIEEYHDESRGRKGAEWESRKGPYLVVLSAKSDDRLKAQAKNLYDFLLSHADSASENLPELAYTLQVGREAMDERVGLIINSRTELNEKLKDFLGWKRTYRGSLPGSCETE